MTGPRTVVGDVPVAVDEDGGRIARDPEGGGHGAERVPSHREVDPAAAGEGETAGRRVVVVDPDEPHLVPGRPGPAGHPGDGRAVRCGTARTRRRRRSPPPGRGPPHRRSAPTPGVPARVAAARRGAPWSGRGPRTAVSATHSPAARPGPTPSAAHRRRAGRPGGRPGRGGSVETDEDIAGHGGEEQRQVGDRVREQPHRGARRRLLAQSRTA